MNCDYSDKFTKFIQEIMKIRKQYEETLEMSDDFKLLNDCIDNFNLLKSNHLVNNITPSYFGDGYMETGSDIQSVDLNSDSSFSSVETTKITELSDDEMDKQESDIEIFDSDKEEDEDPEHTEKLSEMVAISRIFLNKSIKNKMLQAEPINESD